MSSRTYHLVTQLDPAVEAAMKARAAVFFAECRAIHFAESDRNTAAALAAMEAAERPAPKLRLAA